MKVGKMKTVSILQDDIEKNIKLIKSYLLSSESSSRNLVETIPNYMDTIAILERENSKLKNELKSLKESHLLDIQNVNKILNQLASLMEEQNE